MCEKSSGKGDVRKVEDEEGGKGRKKRKTRESKKGMCTVSSRRSSGACKILTDGTRSSAGGIGVSARSLRFEENEFKKKARGVIKMIIDGIMKRTKTRSLRIRSKTVGEEEGRVTGRY